MQWDVMTDSQACQLVSQHLQRAAASGTALGEDLASGAAQALVQASLSAGTMDNVTALVALLPWN